MFQKKLRLLTLPGKELQNRPVIANSTMPVSDGQNRSDATHIRRAVLIFVFFNVFGSLWYFSFAVPRSTQNHIVQSPVALPISSSAKSEVAVPLPAHEEVPVVSGEAAQVPVSAPLSSSLPEPAHEEVPVVSGEAAQVPVSAPLSSSLPEPAHNEVPVSRDTQAIPSPVLSPVPDDKAEKDVWHLTSSAEPKEIRSLVARLLERNGRLAPLTVPESLAGMDAFTSFARRRPNGENITFVHTTWKTICLPLYHVFTRSYMQHDGETQLVFWSDSSIDKFIHDHFLQTKLGAAFRRLGLLKARHAGWYGASRADLFRLLAMWLWGGMYVDFDVNLARAPITFFNAHAQFSGWEPHTDQHNSHLIYKWKPGDREVLTLAGFLGSRRPQGSLFSFYLNRIVDNLLTIPDAELADCNPVDCTSPRIQAKLWWEFYDSTNETERGDAHMYPFHELVHGGIEHHGHCSWCTDVEKDEQSFDIRSMVPARGLILPEGFESPSAPCKYTPGQVIGWNGLTMKPGSPPAQVAVFPPVHFNSSLFSSLSASTEQHCTYSGICSNGSVVGYDEISAEMALSFQCAAKFCASQGKFARGLNGKWACFPHGDYEPANATLSTYQQSVRSSPNVTFFPGSVVDCTEGHPPDVMRDRGCASGASNPSTVLVPMFYGAYNATAAGIVVDTAARTWDLAGSPSACFMKSFDWNAILVEPDFGRSHDFCSYAFPEVNRTQAFAIRGALARHPWKYAWLPGAGLEEVPFAKQGLQKFPPVPMGFTLDMIMARLGIRAIDLLIVRSHGFEADILLGLNLTETTVRVILLSKELPKSLVSARAYIVAHGYEIVGTYAYFSIWVLPSLVSRDTNMWTLDAAFATRLRHGSEYGPYIYEPQDYLRSSFCL